MSEEDEADPWETRIEATGCYEENEALQICRYDTGDWRKCLKEMKAFRDCWQKYKNDLRVSTVDINPDSISDSKDRNLINQVTPDTLPDK
ncbi:Coa4 protein [Starmerella bacillaris]|uniref:Coa4 protein n=1 Tax=Starmerella bacillaris TaxID=1247836 RepID=A0AAV5RI13_STABA|nr:Coa4 protein [Starmerella bacillaris]